MGLIANPVLGKEMFEPMSIVISAINGCEMHVTLHEKGLSNAWNSQATIHDAVRLSAVVKRLSTLI